jgi:hypothetical protein
MVRTFRIPVVLLLATWLSGCASWYFEQAGAPPAPAPKYELAQWPYQEYWTGIVFNGAKIGFSHLSLAPVETQYEVRSDASFVLHFLGLEKKFRFKSTDRVADDLALQRFEHDYHIDGNDLKLAGEVENNTLRVRIVTAKNATDQTLPLAGPVYSTSVLPLYPLLHGLELGREYRYTIYDGETQVLAEVTQTVLAYETSKLFHGPAYKVETRMHGHKTTTWVAANGLPQLEMALNGVLISALETEQQAKRYLALASLNKQDVLLDFSMVRPDRPIPNARRLDYLKIEIEGIEQRRAPPTNADQRCTWANNIATCEIRRMPPPPVITGTYDIQLRDHYLRPTVTAPSMDPRIRIQAQQIAGGAKEPVEIINRLVAWIQANIQRAPVDAFSALDVLETRRAECQGHAYLYTSFARALGIPTRVANGLVYSEELKGFLYHSWNESLVGGAWLSVDPTFGQVGVDATHVKLIEGESSAELMPLVDVVGRIKAKIVAIERP